MISNREIKDQVDELTEQNQFLTQELQQIKDLIQNQNNKQNQNNNMSNNQSGNNGNQISDIANDLLKLKGLTSSLEKKMQEYTSNNSKSTNLTEEDVINLILTMMDGMIDWTIDFVSKQNNQKTQLQ